MRLYLQLVTVMLLSLRVSAQFEVPIPNELRTPVAFSAVYVADEQKYVVDNVYLGNKNDWSRVLGIINDSGYPEMHRVFKEDILIVLADSDFAELGKEWLELQTAAKGKDLAIFWVRNGRCKAGGISVDLNGILKKREKAK